MMIHKVDKKSGMLAFTKADAGTPFWLKDNPNIVEEDLSCKQVSRDTMICSIKAKAEADSSTAKCSCKKSNDEGESDIEADFLKLAKSYVDTHECKNMSYAIEKVCREYPKLYKKYSNEHTLVARE